MNTVRKVNPKRYAVVFWRYDEYGTWSSYESRYKNYADMDADWQRIVEEIELEGLNGDLAMATCHDNQGVQMREYRNEGS